MSCHKTQKCITRPTKVETHKTSLTLVVAVSRGAGDKLTGCEMTLNTFKTGAVALLGIAGVYGTAQADGIDFKGYVRSGIGATSGGGDQVCFQAANTPGKFRLGNECETYSELSLGKSLYKQDGKEFYLQTTVAYVSEQKNGFEGITPQSDFGDGNVASREFAIIGRNVVDQLPGATLWAGKRFYKRNDIHMRDRKSVV